MLAKHWILTADLQRSIQAFEMRCYRKILHISYKDHVTNEEVCKRIKAAIGPYEDLLTIVKKRKLKWYGHITRSLGLAKKHLTGHCARKQKKGQTEKKTVGGQHPREDRLDL
eukprot:TRINITY_DN61654_c0_g1_i8.p1 TRINITY_DN61654_c0_g1~~TRINITY_DN61654_c0_g1_i8.p1  ORF type:complete len:112 (-),score=24.10 TRINITY_DN61654_c0_g1_i8:55-390(-)